MTMPLTDAVTVPPPLVDDPLWWRSAVIYQVYVRSFADSDGDGTGDLRGVRSRLGYLKELGVDALWFNPWYPSPLADGGYDVSDYRDIHPTFGTLEDAELLISEALALGIRTIIDIVPNHISSEHPWFQAALAAGPGSPERERFWFHPGKGPNGDEMPTHWVSNFQGETWTRTTNPDGTPGEWYLHLFTPEQPDLNWNHPDVRREHEDILRFWFDRGVAGVRIDSAGLLIKDPALPEVPAHPAPGQHPTEDRDEVHDVYRAWRHIADSYEGTRVLVGEVWVPDAARFAAYLRPDEMHTAFNFDFMSRPWDAAELRASIDLMLAAHAPVGAPSTWVLSNHDVTRPVTRYGREDSSFAFAKKRFGTPSDLELGGRRARAAALLTAALPGSLYLYQGDELGPARGGAARARCSRIRCTSARAASIPVATDAACRCRGGAPSRRSGSVRPRQAPTAPSLPPGCPSPRSGRRSPCRRRRPTRARCSGSTGRRSASGSASEPSATGR